MSAATELWITRIQAHRYRMPLKRAYGTARGVTRNSTNFVVAITARSGSGEITGYGECQPRHSLTGDGDRRGNAAWGFLVAALGHLAERTIAARDREEAIASIRQLMAELDGLTAEHADDSNRDRAFRGTLLGIEVALLDVAARSLGLQISELLGRQRTSIGISISTISSSTSLEDVPQKVVKQTRFPMTRVKGVGDLDYNWQLLETVASANRSVNREKPLWMDINEALDLQGAMTFVDGLVERMADGRLPASIVLEGVLPKAQVTDLPQLQRHADDACRRVGTDSGLDLRIMPDEGMWDVTDLERVNAHGGCRALNIKAPKAGGLLASLDLARAAVADDPGIHVCIGGMIGTSDLTAWALHNLARALPRIDYLTTVPPTNVEQRIADPVARYTERDSNIIADQTLPGLGTNLVLERVLPYVNASFDTLPASADVVTSQDAPRANAPEPVTLPELGTSAGRTLVFAGDTSLGDVHIRAKGGELLERLTDSPMSFFDGLRPLVADSDAVVLNLETVLADSPTSPFEGRKRFLGWDQPDRTLQCLKELGVQGVSLANNHTMDFGDAHLLQTRELLEKSGIAAIGAGRSLAEASTPLTFTLDVNGEPRRVHVVAACEIQRKLRDEYGFYAGAQKPGVNPLSPDEVASRIREIRAADPTSLIIAFPHWGGNYAWVKPKAQRANQQLVEAGVDLVIGHGAHMLQQCVFADRHATVYSLGNFLFNWAGRFSQYDVPPYGLVARVHLGLDQGRWQVGLRLYPIASDNTKTSFRPRPVREDEFAALWSSLLEKDLDGSFAARARAGRDSRGLCISYEFTPDGTAAPESSAVSEPAAARTASRVGHDAGPIEVLPDDLGVFSKGSTTRLLAQAVADRGYPYEVLRVPGPQSAPDRRRTALRFTIQDRRYFVRSGTIAKERSDGLPGASIDGRAVRICKRKDVTSAILRRRGYSVPRGLAFAASDIDGARLYFDAVVKDSPAGLCVKPANGNKGKKIFLNITSRADFASAFASVAEEYETVLVEESVTGEVLRFLYIGGRVVAVRRGVPANIVGDGSSSIKELVDTKNAELRRKGADRHTRLRLGTDETEFLRRSGYDPETVPGEGERIFLSSLSNRHAAAEIVDCTDDVHPSYREVVEGAANCIPDLAVCGVDVMVQDLARPAAAGNHYFIELNTTPGLRGHHGPSEGTPRDVAGMVIDYVADTLP